jgi:chromosome segregation ATPase
MPSTRSSAADAPNSLARRAERLQALETRVLAARCLAGLGQLAEVILGPRARHEELLLEALLARPRAEALDALRLELLESQRELAARCAALAALERAQSESAELERTLRHELEELRREHLSRAARDEQSAEERDALELGRKALEQIEGELVTLRAERDWRAAEMVAAAAALEGLRFGLLAPRLQARARAWKERAP